ncbi:MAG: hypothetical protein PHW63_09680 [Alphaproteobacteria bacterium]|nr:hypothetical protein [Alphaproteobacteria bacterium]
MLNPPPVTGDIALDAFLTSVYETSTTLETKARPEDGWSLTDFEAPVSEVIGDKRDLINIVTQYDDINLYTTTLAQQQAYLDSIMVEIRDVSEHSDWFATIMEWWDQNYQTITEAQAFMSQVASGESTATAAATTATTAATTATTAKTDAQTAATTATGKATVATDKALEASGHADAAEGFAVNAEASMNTASEAASIAVTAAVSVTQYQGTGFPNGVVAAPVGSIYTDTAATAGAIRWIKSSGGTGNLGWEVEWGDTYWRDITANVLNGWTATGVHLRRLGRIVQFRAYQLDGRNATSNIIFQLPAGFGFGGSGWHLPMTGGQTIEVTGLRNAMLPSGSFYFNGGYHFSSSVIVTDSWPTTLPGTPA